MNGTYGDPNNSWDRFDLNIDDIDPEQLSREFLHNNNNNNNPSGDNNNNHNNDGNAPPIRQLGSRQNSGLSIDDPSGDFLATMSRDLGFGHASGTSFAVAAELAAPTHPAELLPQQQQQSINIDMEPAPLLRQQPVRQQPEASSSQQEPAPQHVASKTNPAPAAAGAGNKPPGEGEALTLTGRDIQDLMVDSVNFICGCSGFLPLQNELFLEVVRQHFTERLKDPEFYELCERRYPVRDEVQPIIEKARQHSRTQDVRIWTVLGKHRLRESNWLELKFEDVTNNFVRRRERLESPLRSVLTKLYTNSTSSKTTRYPTPRSPNAPIQTMSSIPVSIMPPQLQQQQRQPSYGSVGSQIVPPQLQSRQPSYGSAAPQLGPPQIQSRTASYGSMGSQQLQQQQQSGHMPLMAQARSTSFGSQGVGGPVAPMAPQQPSRQASYGSSSMQPNIMQPIPQGRQTSYGSSTGSPQQQQQQQGMMQAQYHQHLQQQQQQQQYQQHHVQQSSRQRSHGEMMMGNDMGMMGNDMGMMGNDMGMAAATGQWGQQQSVQLSNSMEPVPVFTPTPVLPETDRSWELKGEPSGIILYEDAVTSELMEKLNERRTYVGSLFSVFNEQSEDQASTCLARKLAKQWLDERSASRWVCWIDASDPMTITESYRRLVQSLRASDSFEQQPRKRSRLDPASSANEFLQEFNRRFSSQFECLIVYVNVVHPEVFSEAFLPSNWLLDMHCQSTIRGILLSTPHPVFEGNMGPPFGNNVVQHSIEWIPHWSEHEKRYWWDRLPQSNLPPLLDDVEEPLDMDKKLAMDGRALALVDADRERADYAGDIANQFSRRWEMSENSDRFSLWLKADNESTLRESYRLAIRRVTHSAPQNPMGNPVDLSIRVIGDELMSILMKVRELSPTKQWIMIFADANNNYVPFHEKFFSGSSNWWNSKGRFVITTTNRDIELEVMTDGLAYRKKVATIYFSSMMDDSLVTHRSQPTREDKMLTLFFVSILVCLSR